VQHITIGRLARVTAGIGNASGHWTSKLVIVRRSTIITQGSGADESRRKRNRRPFRQELGGR